MSKRETREKRDSGSKRRLHPGTIASPKPRGKEQIASHDLVKQIIQSFICLVPVSEIPRFLVHDEMHTYPMVEHYLSIAIYIVPFGVSISSLIFNTVTTGCYTIYEYLFCL